MKFCLSLAIWCITVALCHGYCFFQPNKEGTEYDGCVDLYDGQRHPFGSTWNTAECLECSCKERGMECCSRYGGPVDVEGCTAVVDPKTCKYKFYKENDPSEPCVF